MITKNSAILADQQWWKGPSSSDGIGEIDQKPPVRLRGRWPPLRVEIYGCALDSKESSGIYDFVWLVCDYNLVFNSQIEDDFQFQSIFSHKC